ncbi:MAG: AAA family ATPase, partial [Bryobacteraceae bacterium]
AKAARAAGLPEKELVKYVASATHQEILAGLGETEADRQHVFGFVRRPTVDTDPRLDALKSHLRVHEFDPGDMKALCALVLAQLSEVIEKEVKRFEDRPALDLEMEAHDRFAEERCRIFIGRQAVLDAIADYIRGPERRPLVLHGESGSGKSAVMAKASQQCKGPGRVIRRFIGASPESASGHALLTSLCRQIAPGETPVDYAQLENAFQERLKAATADQPLVLFIDALDQLLGSDPARLMRWLPPELPPHVKVIVSTTDDVTGLVVPIEPMTQSEGGQALDELLREVRRRLQPWQHDTVLSHDDAAGLVVPIEAMSQSEGGQALDELLGEVRRTLQPWQRKTVLAYFERCGLPLYLKLAAEESRLWKSYALTDACTLGEGVAGVIDTLFDRLATNANHGPVLVQRSLGYLAAARYGLTEGEMLDVLAEDDTVWNDFDQRKHHEVSERRLPVVVWSRLSLDLEPYLTERAAPGGTVISFYHRQLAERVAVRFLAGADLQARHSDLARHFSAKPAWLDEARKAPNARRAVELVFQQRSAGQWTAAEATLFDSQFLFAKCAAGMVLDLDSDYQALLQDAPEMSLARREALDLIYGALQLSMHVVAKEPAQFASQVIGRLLAYRDVPAIRQFIDEIGTDAPKPWLRPLSPALHPPGTGLVRTLESHSKGVIGVAVTPDGKRAVSASWDHTLKVWDLETGRELRTLEGHSASVQGVAVTADGQRAVSASWDNTLKEWDLETGRELCTLEGHSSHVDGVAVTPDGKRAVSASSDDTLKVWDLETGRELRTLEGHSDPVQGVAVTADGKRAVSASCDETLKVWDLETGRALRTLEGHSVTVHGVAVTPDGKRAVSASWDKTLKVWDLETGRELATFFCDDATRCCAVATNRIIVAGDEGGRVYFLALEE